MGARWRVLARDMAAEAGGPPRNGARGRLLVIGSGLCHMDLLGDAEGEILAADHVFHCTNDRVTQAWLGEIRPDAFDLRILYDEGVDRGWTYVRMAEAMVHFVRRGESVVGIFYGHPGVFAAPAHRAVAIARREGHVARMRPGVSALDYLVADLGFDPALPGLLTYEASDMLLRRRRMDPTLHVVLWQVGVVGEFGFSPRGFGNRGFDLLVDEIVEVYGSDWQVVHYIAPQYVGVEPLIERFPAASLRGEDARKNLSTLSTFYVAPRDPVAVDGERSLRLGATREGEVPPGPRRDFLDDAYGEAELAAVRSLEPFMVPPHYFVERMSPAAEFMLAVSRDPMLRERYRAEAERLLAEPRFASLTPRARRLLAIPHPMAISAALAEPSVDRSEREATPAGEELDYGAPGEGANPDDLESDVEDHRSAARSVSSGRRHLFVGGLHRSGTTALTRMLQSHPAATGLVGTGAAEDEGQYLQDVLVPDTDLGGPGSFCFDPRARMTERDASRYRDRVPRLMRSWERHWDPRLDLRVEKSPPNLVRSRVLQALVPGSAFVFIVRHPLVVAAATAKWATESTLKQLVRHWVVAHRFLLDDLPSLENASVVRYEDVAARPGRAVTRIWNSLGLPDAPVDEGAFTNHNRGYLAGLERSGRIDEGQLSTDEAEVLAAFGYVLDAPYVGDFDATRLLATSL